MASYLSPSQQLSTPQSFETNIKAPRQKTQAFSKNSEDENGCITVDICSEFAPYRANLEYVKKSCKVKLLHSKAGLPIIFSLADDSSLSLLQHGMQAIEGWSSLDITPSGKKVATFDVVKLAQTLFIAVSCQDTSRNVPYHDLYFAEVEADPASISKLSASREKDQPWIKVEDNLIDPVGDLIHSSLLCRPALPKEPHAAPSIEVVVGTRATPGVDGKFGTLYCVNLAASPERRWHTLSFPGAPSALLQAESLTIGPVDGSNTEVGIISAFRDFSKDAKARVVGHINDSTGGVIRTFEFKTGKLGGVRSVFSHRNPWHRTDIFVAAEKGIGFYTGLPAQSRVDMLASEPILPNISFQQVFCSESVDPANPQTQTKIAIFAISDDRSLYYIEGIRSYDTRTVVFQASGLPLRRGVIHMSTAYSATHGTSELLYALEAENALLYLRREPNGQFWLEDKVFHRSRKVSSYDAFITSIALKDGSGKQLEAGFPINLKGEFTQVVSNARSFTLNPTTPTTVYTDGMGCIEIVQASQRHLACPPIRVEISSQEPTDDKEPYTFDVISSSRIDNLLSDIKDASSLESALSDGKGKPFTGGGIREAGEILGQISLMKNTLSNTDDSHTGENAQQAQDLHATDLGSTILGVLGECIEAMKTVVKTAVKVVIHVVGSVVRATFTILNRVFKFVIKTAFSLYRVVGNLLEDYLGFDGLNRLLDYLKMVFDPESVKQTQEVLRGAITGCLDLTGRFLEVNKDSISDLFDDGKTFLENFLEDPRQPSQGKIGNIINQILNNPVVRLLMKINPLQWIMEAVTEELADFQIPPFAETIDKVLSSFGDAVDKQVKILDKLLETFTSELQQVCANPSPEGIKHSVRRTLEALAWTLFDTIRNIFESIYDALTTVFQSVSSILDGTWKLPGITDMWEEMTDQEFTLLGLVTYLPAVLLNFVSIGVHGKLPFDGFELPDFEAIEVKPLYQSSRKTEPQSPDGKRPFSATANSIPLINSQSLSLSDVSDAKNDGGDLNMPSTVGFSLVASGSGRLLQTNTSSGLGRFSMFVTIVTNLGRIFNAAGRFFQAQDAFGKAVNQEPGNNHPPGIVVGGDGGGGGVGGGGPRHIGQALRSFASWMPSIGRFIGAAGNIVLVVWHLRQNPASLAPGIVMAGAAISELVIVSIELRYGDTQALRLVGEILGRGTGIATTVLQGDWEFGPGTVAVVLSSVGGIAAEAFRLSDAPQALIAAGVGHGQDFIWCCVLLASLVIPFEGGTHEL